MAIEDARFTRTRMLLGDRGVAQLQTAHVAVFGVGGVGGYCVEALARSGVGTLTIIDADVVDPTNLNRQIIALESTLGRPKVQVMAERIADINPACRVHPHQVFYLPETADAFDFSSYDYVVDCVDTVSAKLSIIEASRAAGTPVISSMGAGNKLDPTRFEVADISETSVDPLARVMRRELRRRGVQGVKVVYSTEPPMVERNQSNLTDTSAADSGQTSSSLRDLVSSIGCNDDALAGQKSASRHVKPIAGSVAFVPSVAGLILASEVIKDITCKKG